VEHFSALADRYDAEARRHEVMAASSTGNPRGNVGAGMSLHCGRLAALNTESANTLRELAGHHKTLASGAPSTVPRDAARFEGGAGAPEPTEAELKSLAAAIAHTYRGTRIAQAAVHCERIVANAREAAKEATAAAEMHRGLAIIGR
jgi:hypothetical protein